MMCRPSRSVRAIAIAAACSIASLATVAPSAAADVTLDASRPLQEGAADDFTAMRRIIGSASMPEANGGLGPVQSLTKDLGTRWARIINDAEECTGNAPGELNRCDRLAGNLAWLAKFGLGAHVVVGQRQPPHMPLPGAQWGPAEWALYQAFAEKLVRWIALEYNNTGFEQTLFEVGNEVDISGDARALWTLANPNPAQGDATRYEHYMRVYRVWSNAVAKVAAQAPNRRIAIGGPSMGGQGLFLNGRMYHETFIAQVQQEGLRLDAVTHHFYSDLLNGWPNTPGSAFADQMRTIQRALNANGLGDRPIIVSEFGQAEDSSGAAVSKINYRHEGGAWAARFVFDALATGVRGGSFLLFRDVFGADANGNANIASLTHVRGGVDFPRPAANVFQMFAMLPGTRRTASIASGLPSAVKAIGGASQEAAGMLVFNYDYRFGGGADYRDLTTAQSVRVGFAGLPFSGQVTVERYLVDETTSNIGRYIEAGATPSGAEAQLTRVEALQANVAADGSLVLDARTLGPSGVSLWMVRK